MNRSYRLVFSARVGDVVVAGENARSRSRAAGARGGAAFAPASVLESFALLGAAMFAFLVVALLSLWMSPEAGVVLGTIGTGVNKQLKYKVEGTWGTGAGRVRLAAPAPRLARRST
jgi:hypothetical protein